MSEQGWQGFLAAEGVDDWVVLHGGATAAYGVASMGAAARLETAIAAGGRVVDASSSPSSTPCPT